MSDDRGDEIIDGTDISGCGGKYLQTEYYR